MEIIVPVLETHRNPPVDHRWLPVEDVHKFRSVIPLLATGETFLKNSNNSNFSASNFDGHSFLGFTHVFVNFSTQKLDFIVKLFSKFIDFDVSKYRSQLDSRVDLNPMVFAKFALFLGLFVAFLGDISLISPPKN